MSEFLRALHRGMKEYDLTLSKSRRLIVRFLMRLFDGTDQEDIKTVFENENIRKLLAKVISGRKVINEFIAELRIFYKNAEDTDNSDISRLNIKCSFLKNFFEEKLNTSMDAM